MKQLIFFCLGLLLICCLYSCDNFGHGWRTWNVTIVNHFDNNIGIAIYAHETNSTSADVSCLFPSIESVAPQDSVLRGHVFDGKYDTWKAFFEYKKIDTLYVAVISPEVDIEAKEISDLYDNDDIYMVYKFYDGNFDMSQNDYTIYYPM